MEPQNIVVIIAIVIFFALAFGYVSRGRVR